MPSWPDEAGSRVTALAAARHNVARLPTSSVTADLTTDAGQPSGGTERSSGGWWGGGVRDGCGTGRWRLAGSGRGAEAVVAAALVRPGARVLANEVYVSGHWWIERFGGAVAPLSTSLTGESIHDVAY